MPIFQYECPEGHISEQLVSQSAVESDDAHVRSMTCDQCTAEGKLNLAERILSPTPTTFRFNDRKAIK